MCIKLEDMKDSNTMLFATERMKIGARWFEDVINNGKNRECIIKMFAGFKKRSFI